MNFLSRFNPVIGLVSVGALLILQTQNINAVPASQVNHAAVPVPQVNNAPLPAPEVNKIAKQITVRIDGANTGSGVIVNQQGNTYTVLTNMHVVEYAGNYRLQTYDGRVYAFNHKQTQIVSRGVDLALLEFTSTATYRTAEIGNSDQLSEGTSVYVAGWADPDAVSNQRSYRFQDGRIAARLSGDRNGYNLVYSNVTKPGMSGGPVLDEQGRLIGINGQALTDERIAATDFYGIPINIYLKFATAKTPNINSVTSSSPSIRNNLPSKTTIVIHPTNIYRPNNNNPRQQSNYLSNNTISSYLKVAAVNNSNPNTSFIYLNKALEAAGLTEILQGKGRFTLFAPTDAAIAKLPLDATRDLLKPENKEVLLKIIKYHIVQGKVNSRALKTGELQSIEGGNINVQNNGNNVMVNDAKLVQSDIETSNGVIHAIDNLILPPDL